MPSSPGSEKPAPTFHACPARPDCPYCGGAADATPGRFDWSFLDGVYCISLRHRDDRADETAREFHRLGLCARAIFHRPLKDRKAKRGCWESHRAVAADARTRGWRRVLIVEDDVCFAASTSPETAARVGAALADLPADWMGFYLGHWALWAYPAGRDVLRCSSLCTHAYVASERLLDWLCETPYEARNALPRHRIGGRGLDATFAALPGMFAFTPLVATQRLIPGDNMNAPTIRWWPPKSLVRDLFVRSRIREYAMAHGMRANERVAIALAGVSGPIFRASARRAQRRLARHRAALAPDSAPP
jgi:hypothetical protein